MIRCVTAENMRQSDAWTIANRTDGRTLMYRAALGTFLARHWSGETVIAAGSGNNGGDGYALACILTGNGIKCRVVSLGEPRTDDAGYFAGLAARMGVVTEPWRPGCLRGCAEIADCLLGTGFHGDVRRDCAQVIREINVSGAFVVSVDINSGMEADTGLARTAVRSNLTVAVGSVKLGMTAPGAGEFIGRLVCVDIGIVFQREEYFIYSLEEWQREHDDKPEALLCPQYLDMRTIDVSDVRMPQGFDERPQSGYY